MSNTYQTVLYIGITNNLERRVAEHKSGEIPGFTQKYNVTYLLYFEESQSRIDAIAREKQLKGWTRKKKMNLLKSKNPTLRDLSS